jgi:hydroxyethylthiazole kinase-like sugar kinase family protein
VSSKVFEVLMIVELLSHWQPTVIKGNAAEIGAMAESTEVCILPSRTT